MQSKLGYVSLFSSAGVGCYGFKLESYDCIVTSELIKRRLAIQKYNRVCSSDAGYVAGDISSNTVQQQIFTAIADWLNNNHKKDVDVLIATPPCQGISVANHKKKDELSRNSLVVESIKIIAKVEPRYFIFENVRGFLKTLCTDIDGTTKPILEAIRRNLAGHYNIGFRVINFKDYGSNSSRTRTVVIGVRKDIEEVTPYDLFPEAHTAPSLRSLIGDLPKLVNMGQISASDIYHSFKTYDARMMPWILDTREGESAFMNTDPAKRPHKVINGVLVENQNKNSDKYKRCYWDSVAPCVHTRNDILASQNTIHPNQPRVFSIRELMRFMSIPDSFVWSEESAAQLNHLTLADKKLFLKKHEMNIRQCLGEGVPTGVFQSIAQKLRNVESREIPSISKIKRLIEKHDLGQSEKLLCYLTSERPEFITATKIAELANAKRLDNAAYYTRQDLCFNLVADLPDFASKKTIRILEPAVGVGNFLPVLFEKYKTKTKVNLDLMDISADSIKVLKKILKTLNVPKNFELRLIVDDFLLHDFRTSYDLVVGNPPFGKVSSEIFNIYKARGVGAKVRTRNIFALFFEKALQISDGVAFFSPKSLLNAPEFTRLRQELERYTITHIADYGEKGFNGVKIETISLCVTKQTQKGVTIVDSYPLKRYTVYSQDYVIDKMFPYWLLYRSSFFDEMSQKLRMDIFSVYRDRSLTSKHMKSSGSVRVVKSRNIRSGSIVDLPEDQFVESSNVSRLAEQFYNAADVIIAPNLSYYPRATFLPSNAIVDGSAAILVPKKMLKFTLKDLEFFASREYFIFYRVARNYATRSLNIDSNSVYFWGIPKVNMKYTIFDDSNRSRYLFADPSSF